ncbi:hypothetical protein [Glaciecola petra]|uniref:Transmembrane protein n=1 Tax=Glaciecola petra TaxID=3075602 RepID=A0ABU2ZUJ2_9ALTE|nr:hypothetical protein [Aestuariibacter sp. P117]MDT0595087.1 hypothetical protein [Aestuariibacter sp. P117]
MKNFFHAISYLQYPLLLVMIYFVVTPLFNDFEEVFVSFNLALVFMGLSVSFSTLQDTSKTQNKASLKVWQSPRKGKLFLTLLGLLAMFFVVMGIMGMLFTFSTILSQIALGMVVTGVSIISMLKAALEMFENHRLDKNPASSA